MKKVILKRHFFAEKFGGFKKKHYLCQSEHWRDGRVVDYSSLENYRTERYRGFESLSLRQQNVTLLIIRGLHSFLTNYPQFYPQFWMSYPQNYPQK